MAIEEVLNFSGDIINNSAGLAGDVIHYGLLALKIIGGFVVFWVLVQLINLFLNWRRYRSTAKVREDLVRIEAKLDKVLKKKK